MLKLDSPIDLNLEAFLRWWGGELAFLVPARLLKFLGAKRARLILTRSDTSLTAAYSDEAGVRALGQWPLDEAAQGRHERLLAEHPELEDAELVLCLGPEQSLVKTFKLPAVAEENLRQVAAFEMDRLTPFKAEQVYFDVRLLDRLAQTRQIRVELALAPREKLDLILDELLAMGWRPERVDVGHGTEIAGHDLLPDKFRPPKSRWPKIFTIASAALLSSLIIAVLVLPIIMNHKLAEELEKETKRVGKTAMEVNALREKAEKMADETGFLTQKKRKEPIVLDMLEELTRVIPDNTSLNGLQYRDQKVIIQGQSPAASSLIERIEASPYFKNTNFVSPVTKDISSGQERFQISSEVVNGRFSENPAE